MKKEYTKELPKGEMQMPGLRWTGTYWEEITTEIDSEMIQSEPPAEKKLTCECGASSINSIGHANWCPLGGENV